MDAIAALLDDALARGLGSAAAVSVGDGGREVGRIVRGVTQRAQISGTAGTAGVAGVEVTADTPFDVASLTKPIATAAAAMVLVGERRLDLDAPVRHWLPAATTGSVRQLLGHAAGCAAHVEFFRALRGGGFADPRGELIARAAREPAGPPGVAAVYSDLGYLVLGAVLERVADRPLEAVFGELVADPLALAARFPGDTPLAGAVATELDDRGLVCGRVHDENAYWSGGVGGHAGLFASLADVARFAAAVVAVAAGTPRGRLQPAVFAEFVRAPAAPGASWRLGFDTPATAPGVSHAGDRWPRVDAIGHLGFTGTSMWLDLARGRWCVLLTNRVHPTRHADTAAGIKALRRAVNDAAVALLDVPR